MLAYYGYFGRARADRIASIDAERARLLELDAQLETEEQQLAALEDEARVQLDNVQRGRKERAAVVKELDQELKSRRTQLARLKREGLTILLAEQNTEFSLELADRVYVLEKGSIRFSGPAARLRDDAALRQELLAL